MLDLKKKCRPNYEKCRPTSENPVAASILQHYDVTTKSGVSLVRTNAFQFSTGLLRWYYLLGTNFDEELILRHTCIRLIMKFCSPPRCDFVHGYRPRYLRTFVISLTHSVGINRNNSQWSL